MKGPAEAVMPDIDALEWHRALLLQGWVVLHGAAFELGARSVLALGGSGAGKSTLAVAVARCGGRILSDDLVACRLEGDANRAVGRALRAFVSLREGGREVFPRHRLAALRVLKGGKEVRWVLKPEDAPELFVQRVTLDTIWLCTIGESLVETESAPAAAGEALGVLLASTSAALLKLDDARLPCRLMGILSGLISACRTQNVLLGRDLLARPEPVVEKLMRTF